MSVGALSALAPAAAVETTYECAGAAQEEGAGMAPYMCRPSTAGHLVRLLTKNLDASHLMIGCVNTRDPAVIELPKICQLECTFAPQVCCHI